MGELTVTSTSIAYGRKQSEAHGPASFQFPGHKFLEKLTDVVGIT